MGKFPNSTNERKQMSTKTIKQRIAVVAVSALTAGLFSVVSAPVANAALPTGQTANQLYIATTQTTTGSTAAGAGVIDSTRVSIGFISDTSATAATAATNGLTITGGLAKTAVVNEKAKISVSASSSAVAASGVSLVVTGGTLGGVIVNSSAATIAFAGDTKSATAYGSGTAAEGIVLTAEFAISAAVGSTATLAAYTGTAVQGLTTATSGSLLGLWTFTVAAANASGAVSLADSYVTTQSCISKGATIVGTVTGYDSTSRCANGTVGIIRVQLRDAYTAAITTGALAASSPNGIVNVELATNNGEIDVADSYAGTTGFESLDPDAVNYILVNQPVANTAGSSVVTITHNGSPVAVKTINFAGQLASLTVDTVNSAKNFANGATEANTPMINNVYFVAKDAAGNNVSMSDQPSIEGTGAMVGVTVTTSTAQRALMSSSTGYGSTTLIIPGGSASTLRGAGTYQLSTVNASGATIKSAVMPVTVAYLGTDKFEVAWNKASYVPGEIAEMTLTLKDPYGNLVADGTDLTGLDLVAPTAGFTAVGSACTSSRETTAGVVVCKYAAGNTGGSYSYSVDMTTNVNPQSALTGSVVIKTSGATNEDVLKSIVALIASINKQIQALQKLILKR